MRFEVVAVGVCVLLASTTAWAEDNGRDEGNGRDTRAADSGVPVNITGELAGVSLRVADAETDRTVATCKGACSFRAAPGPYTIYSFDPASGERHELGLRLRHASQFRFSAGDSTAKTAGLVTGIAGPALILTGFILIAPLLLSSICEDSNCSSQGQRTAAQVGLGALVLGAVATPVGWTVFASNRTRLVEVNPEEASATPGFSLRFGIAGLGPGAFGIASSGHF